MSEQDIEIEWLKAGVSCAALLERLPPPWRLDRAQSTRQSLKYRRGEAEILIVNHDGRGWWDPLSDRKGDIFTLVRHLDPGLTFGAARRMLRDFVAIAPTFPEAVRTWRMRASSLSVVQRWERCQPLSDGSPAWLYLTGQPSHGWSPVFRLPSMARSGSVAMRARISVKPIGRKPQTSTPTSRDCRSPGRLPWLCP